jgi:hypothetical protein
MMVDWLTSATSRVKPRSEGVRPHLQGECTRLPYTWRTEDDDGSDDETDNGFLHNGDDPRGSVIPKSRDHLMDEMNGGDELTANGLSSVTRQRVATASLGKGYIGKGRLQSRRARPRRRKQYIVRHGWRDSVAQPASVTGAAAHSHIIREPTFAGTERINESVYIQQSGRFAALKRSYDLGIVMRRQGLK